jgi:hypothetical protein
MARLGLVMVVLLAAAGCAHEYAYWPAGPAGGGGPAARYPIPPEAPRGEVYVTSFGYTDMDVNEGQSALMPHARLVVVNNGPDAWTLDGREQQLLVAPNQTPLRPAFANTDAGQGPLYTVPPATRRTFDFYYQVPPPLDDPRNVGWFELEWRVNAGAQPIAQRTPFQRFEDRPAGYNPYPAYVFVGLGWGPLWWYDPFYRYVHPPIIRGYYYPPIRGRTYGPTWRGVPRTAPPGGGWRGMPPPSGGGWRGSPSGGGWRGAPPSGGGWRGSPGGGFRGSPGGAPRGSPGGGWRGSPR